jgi:hypothetical protein
MLLAVAGPVAFLLIEIVTTPVHDKWITVFGFLALLLVMGAWLFAGIRALFAAGSELFAKRYRRAASMLVLPLAVLVAGLNYEIVWSTHDYVAFFLGYRSFIAEINRLPADKPRLVVWNWRTTKTVEIGLAYDESDEIASDHPSESWKQRAYQVGIRGSGYPPFYGHFYLFPYDLTAGNAHFAE